VAADAGAEAEADAAFCNCKEGGWWTLSADGGIEEDDSGRVALGAWPGVWGVLGC